MARREAPAPERVMALANRHHPTTNQLLGYPDDARLLIINADDFGMCHAVNEAVFQLLAIGAVTSTTVMAPCPWAPHALQWLATHPELPFGVHLALVSEFPVYRWGPVASKDRVPSLIDAAGFFYPHEQIPELLARAKLDEVEAEFRAQIGTVLRENLKPTHLDWHCLPGGGRADIFELTFNLARENGLALRVHDRTMAERCQHQGLPTSDHGILDSYRLDPDEKPTRYRELLRSLPVGLSEWAVHPSLGDAEAQALEPQTWRIRRADFDFFRSSAARDMMEAEGIALLDYRSLQRVWAERPRS